MYKKGRIPTAIGKPAKELLEHEKLFIMRMVSVIEVPEISEIINGNKLNLTIGGVIATIKRTSVKKVYGEI
jgi:hypothetical protein